MIQGGSGRMMNTMTAGIAGFVAGTAAHIFLSPFLGDMQLKLLSLAVAGLAGFGVGFLRSQPN